MDANQTDMVLLDQFRVMRDEQAFAEIVRRYAGVVYTTSLRLLGDAARAEEVSQETFFRLMQKPQSVTRSVGGWLHRVATQLAIDVIRADSSRRQREQDYSRENPQQVSRWEQLSPMIDEALSELPDEHRDLLVRHFLQGVAQAKLADEAQTSAATMSRRIKTAIDMLRKQLKRKGVLAAAAMVSAFFHNGSAAAAPPELMAQLGKIAMISGTKATAESAAVVLPRTPTPFQLPVDGAVTTGGKITIHAAVAFTLVAAAVVVLLIVMWMGGGSNSSSTSDLPAATSSR